MTTQAQPIRSIDDDIALLVDINDRIALLDEQRAGIRARIADQGLGEYAAHGVTVTVRPPSRRFNRDKALALLTDEQRTVCMAPSDALIKKQIPPVLLDTCMDDGTGNPIVSVK